MKSKDRDNMSDLYMENWTSSDTSEILKGIPNANVWGDDDVRVYIPASALQDPEVRELLLKLAPHGEIKINKTDPEDLTQFSDEDKAKFDDSYAHIKTNRKRI